MTVSSSLCTDLTFSSAAIFLPVGRAKASVGIKVTCLTYDLSVLIVLCQQFFTQYSNGSILAKPANAFKLLF